MQKQKSFRIWCPGRDLNPHDPFESTDFKSVASADFATRATGPSHCSPPPSQWPVLAPRAPSPLRPQAVFSAAVRRNGCEKYFKRLCFCLVVTIGFSLTIPANAS